MSLDQKLLTLITELNAIPPASLPEFLINNSGARHPEIEFEENKIHGCISKLYIKEHLVGNRLHFVISAEARSVQGLGKLLSDLFSDQPPNDILSFQFEQLSPLKYSTWLSDSRQNAFKQVFIRIKLLSQKY